ncbi:MAG: hypothetical protein O2912_06795 [Proteobacteria bacterium]|nr:hypothetical protein [Pseudomonadota bacterium]
MRIGPVFRSRIVPAALAVAFGLIAAGSSQACSFTNTAPDRKVLGYNMYANKMMYLQGVKSKKRLAAYVGVRVGSLEACVRSCVGDKNCAGATWRPKQANNCLKYAYKDFVTGERMQLWYFAPSMNYFSVLVRWHKNGKLCK